MKFFVSTGEVSGDLHLSYLVKAIHQENKNIKFYGVAGEHSKGYSRYNRISYNGFYRDNKKI